MDSLLLALRTEVFIVRIWREPRELPASPAVWRGVVEHVPSGQRRYFEVLDEAMAFITQIAWPNDE